MIINQNFVLQPCNSQYVLFENFCFGPCDPAPCTLALQHFDTVGCQTWHKLSGKRSMLQPWRHANWVSTDLFFFYRLKKLLGRVVKRFSLTSKKPSWLSFLLASSGWLRILTFLIPTLKVALRCSVREMQDFTARLVRKTCCALS